MCTQIVVESCLSEVERIWRQIPEEKRPWGVWIAYHQPINKNQDSDQPDTDVISAWFLSDDGIQKRSAWSYVRFRVIQSGKFWCSRMFQAESSPVFSGVHRLHEIGLSSFAFIENEHLVYLDYLWGGNYGCGALYKIEHFGNINFDSRIWIS
jgi:hypothetical protein